jgi:proline iminopeptidase
MWQANNDNSNAELRNQFPETWEKIQKVRAEGFNTCSKEYQDANDVSPAFLMFYNTSNFDKIMAGGGSVNNDVYCAITGEDADFLVSGDMGKFDYRLDLKKLTMPLLILVGRYDRIAFPRWTIRRRSVLSPNSWQTTTPDLHSERYGLFYIRGCQEHFCPSAGCTVLIRDIQPLSP